MAYTTATLKPRGVAAADAATGLLADRWRYISSADALATIGADNYFSDAAIKRLRAGDEIYATGTDGSRLYQVVGVTSSGATLAQAQDLDGLDATPTEINRVADVSARLVAAGGTLAVTAALHDGKVICLDTLAGSACTLPAATGTGAKFTFIVTVNPTSNAHTIACAGTDEFAGVIFQIDADTSDATQAYAAQAADNYDTITLEAAQTKGGDVGDWIEVVDILSGVWALRGHVIGTGSVASMFSAS